MILSIESSTKVCSLAIHSNGMLLDSKFVDEPQAASSQLIVEAKNLLNKNSISPTELRSVAVCSGPGSYTGLRIGTSTAKGLCYALNLPLISVNSLLVLAYPIIKEHRSDLYCPMLDARRLEVYCCLLRPNFDFETKTEAKILDTTSFHDELEKNKIIFFGEGSVKFKTLTNHTNAIFVDGVYPEAKHLGPLAEERFLKNDFEDLEQFEPIYLKDFMVKKKILL
jgi:tRNA threonylcarbamoyladenosine biosynthesis protein TsaB